MVRGGRRADGERNREAILTAATTLLAETPDASLNDVAAAAGVTRATVYRHFDNRDALLDEMIRRNATGVVQELLAGLDALRLDKAFAVLAERIVVVAAQSERFVAAAAHRIQHLAQGDVTAGPVTAFVARRRAAGEVTSDLGDAWIATCMRTLTLQVVLEGRPPPGRDRELAQTLQVLVR